MGFLDLGVLSHGVESGAHEEETQCARHRTREALEPLGRRVESCEQSEENRTLKATWIIHLVQSRGKLEKSRESPNAQHCYIIPEPTIILEVGMAGFSSEVKKWRKGQKI